MKLDTTPQDVAVSGNFKTSAFGMEASAHAFDIIADKIYTHKIRAVIREICCNAHDAHQEAGNPEPFDVHLPTQLEPHFTVRDYGVGLSDNDVRFIFCNTFKSTKQNTNSQIGCLGLGSKSPFCLADSFTVKSWHDGMCRTYSCYRDEQRKPNVALLTETPSDESNGIEISLSIEDKVYEFEQDAIEVFRYWEYTPNINNKMVVAEIQLKRDRFSFIGDEFALSPNYGTMKAVMGNVAYDIPDELDDFDSEGYLKFDLGEISFDAGRESLSLDDRTKQAIKDKFKKVKHQLAETAIQQIKEKSTPFQRAILANELGGGQLGRHITADLSEFTLPELSESFVYFQRHYGSTERNTSKRIPLGKNIDYYEFKPKFTTRIRHHLKDCYRHTIVLLTPEQITECKIDVDVLKDLNDLPKVARQNYSPGSTVKTFTFASPKYHWSIKDSRYWEENELEIDGDEMVYVEINRWEPQESRSFASSKAHHYISGTNQQIQATQARLKDCKIDVPVLHGLKTAYLKTKAFKSGNWIHLDDYVQREVAKIAPKGIYVYLQNDYDKIAKLHEKIKSPELDDWFEVAKSSKNGEIAKFCENLSIPLEQDNFLQELHEDFFAKYPILTILSDWEIKGNAEHIYEYIGGTLRNSGSGKTKRRKAVPKKSGGYGNSGRRV